MKSEITRVVTSLCYLFILVVCFPFITSDFAKGAGDQLSNKRYVDPKGYFKIVPPADWRIQEYPQDSRGKVAFIAPEPNVELRILVNAVDCSTTDELVKYCKNIENRIGIFTNIEKTDFCERSAVRRSFEAKGAKFFLIDFLVESVDHNIQFSAPPNLYQKYLSIVTKSMETYETVVHSRSGKDIIEHKVAKNVRLAQL